jgi:hypothetical protein
MKKIITYLIILSYTIVGFSQTKNDVVNFKQINLKLLDSLIFDEAMKERKKMNLKPLIHDDICAKTAKYQSDYCSNYNEINHENNKNYLGVFLKNPSDRFNFYLNKTKTKLNYELKIEILTQYKNVSSTNYVRLTSKTYEDYAKNIIKNFMLSSSHKDGLLFEMDDYGIIHGEYKTSYNSKTDCLTTTGFFVLVFEYYKGKKVDLLSYF